MALKSISELYECRDCCAVFASRLPFCPVCYATEGPERTYSRLEDGEPKTKNLPWYRVREIEASE